MKLNRMIIKERQIDCKGLHPNPIREKHIYHIKQEDKGIDWTHIIVGFAISLPASALVGYALWFLMQLVAFKINH